MYIDPKFRFAVALIVFVAVGISQGAVNLAHAIPGEWIPVAVAWCGIIAFVGTGITTVMSGMGMTVTSRIGSAAAVDGVKEIKVDPKLAPTATAAAADNAKVTT